MKRPLSAIGFAALTVAAYAGPQAAPVDAPPQPPPPVIVVPGGSVAVTQTVYVYEQKPVGNLPPLVSPQQAQTIIDKFKTAYPKLGSPRLLIYVNRALVDEKSGEKLASRVEHVDRTTTKFDSTGQPAGADPSAAATGKVTTTTEKTSGDYSYTRQPAAELSLADKQTVRDVERLFGRPLRMGGASLADQQIATQLIGSKQLQLFGNKADGDQAAKDRLALGNIADVVIEVLISSRQVVVPGITSDKVVTVPDIQCTAIRLKDSKILGQASATDILGKDSSAARLANSFDVREITEGVALALMEDMTLGLN